LTPTILPGLLFTIRTTIFPSNARAPPRQNNDISPPAQQLKQGQPVHSAAKADVSSPDAQDASTSDLASKPGGSTPSPSEVAAIKRRCATDILSLIPGSVAQAFFGANTENRASDFATTGADNDITNDRSSNQPTKGNDQQFSTAGDSSRDGVAAATAVDNCEEKREDDDNAAKEELLEAIETDLLDPFSDSYCNKHLIFAIIEIVLVKIIPELSEHSISGLLEERGVPL